MQGSWCNKGYESFSSTVFNMGRWVTEIQFYIQIFYILLVKSKFESYKQRHTPPCPTSWTKIRMTLLSTLIHHIHHNSDEHSILMVPLTSGFGFRSHFLDCLGVFLTKISPFGHWIPGGICGISFVWVTGTGFRGSYKSIAMVAEKKKRGDEFKKHMSGLGDYVAMH